MKTWKQLCEEVYQWSRKNFGEQGPCRLACGIAEEALYEMGSAEMKEDWGKQLDAIADAAIFMLNLIGMLGLDPEEVMDKMPASESLWSTAHSTGMLCRACLKMEQGIRREESHIDTAEMALADIRVVLAYYVGGKDKLLELVNKVWDETVSKRDWTKEAGR